MELGPGLQMIEVPFEGSRSVNSFLFSGGEHLLVDTGVAGSPTEIILPHLENVGLGADELDLVINLHAHADHIGGNGEVFAATGQQVRFAAQALDADAIEDHQLLATQVYGLADREQIRQLLARCGANVPVSYRYRGGEMVDLEGLTLEVSHAPGHMAGNLALYDPASRTLVQGESVMGPPQRNEQGFWSTPFGPDPLAYRETIVRLGGLDFALLLSSHRAPMDLATGMALIETSLEALDRFLEHCRAAFADGVASMADLAVFVAARGAYQATGRLEAQVSKVAEAWLAEGLVVKRPSGTLTLAQ